jgi:hypothetical protein
MCLTEGVAACDGVCGCGCVGWTGRAGRWWWDGGGLTSDVEPPLDLEGVVLPYGGDGSPAFPM